MTRPPVTDFALGSRTAVIGSTGMAALLTLAWLGSQDVSWFAVLLALLFCRACFRARRRVAVWRAWSNEWNAMADAGRNQARPANAQPAAEQQAIAPSPGARRIPRWTIVIAWLGLVAWIMAHESDRPDTAHGLVALCFIGLTLWGGFAICVRLGRWLLAPSSRPGARRAARDSATDSEGNPIVTQCLPVPRATPSGQGRVYDLLPPYCRALLAPGKATSDVQPEGLRNHAG